MAWKLLSCYLEWNVIQYNFNHKKIETRNIFDHGRFREEVDQLLHKKMDKKTFAEELDRSLRYYFWCKSEYEILISPWIGDETAEQKVDIYWQIKNNWKLFVDYLWKHKEKGSKL